MMRRFLLLAFLAVFLVFGVTAVAQGPDLPNSAQSGVDSLAVWLAIVAGLAANALTDAIKGLPWLTDGDKAKIAGPTANLVAAVIAVGSGYILAVLSPWAVWLDESGIWQVVLFAWPFAKGWFEVAKIRQGLASMWSGQFWEGPPDDVLLDEEGFKAI